MAAGYMQNLRAECDRRNPLAPRATERDTAARSAAIRARLGAVLDGGAR